METDFCSRVIAKQVWRLCFHLIGQKKLAAQALAILIGLPHRFSFEIAESGKARRRLLRDQVAALTVRDYAGLRGAPSTIRADKAQKTPANCRRITSPPGLRGDHARKLNTLQTRSPWWTGPRKQP